MYTVVRFIAGPACSDETLIQLGRTLNGLLDGAFKRLDHVGRRFSISISSANDWAAHVDALLAFVQNVSAVIAEAKTKGVEVVADTALEPEDVRGKPYLACSLPPAALQELAAQGVGITFTCYGSV
jgi:hypothetical protein